VLFYADEGKLELASIQPTESDQNMYIAISHVWADGLGNPDENSMYRCQLKLMQERVTNVARRMRDCLQDPQTFKAWFWIDTLCVQAEESPEKTAAIASMETVYKKAAAVLVIDSDLELIDEVFWPAHITIMILSSMWITRLWTIQEAAFAHEVFFQLRNFAITESQLRSVTARSGIRHT
jgi:hypothetical protein